VTLSSRNNSSHRIMYISSSFDLETDEGATLEVEDGMTNNYLGRRQPFDPGSKYLFFSVNKRHGVTYMWGKTLVWTCGPFSVKTE
jgi:hypothetical protein